MRACVCGGEISHDISSQSKTGTPTTRYHQSDHNGGQGMKMGWVSREGSGMQDGHGMRKDKGESKE